MLLFEGFDFYVIFDVQNEYGLLGICFWKEMIGILDMIYFVVLFIIVEIVWMFLNMMDLFMVFFIIKKYEKLNRYFYGILLGEK